MHTTTQILLIYTGGTIGMRRDPKTTALIPFDFETLLESIPELHQLSCNISTKSFDSPLDSADMDVTQWVALGDLIYQNYENYDGFVVLHGTDTMAFTASALSFMFENLSKPILFTGSQLPIGDLRTDAKENVITAIHIANISTNLETKKRCNTNLTPCIHEVCLYFEYKLWRANRTTKVNADHFNAFKSYNYPPLIESGVLLKTNTPYLLPPPSLGLRYHRTFDTAVVILKLFPGMHPQILEGILENSKLKAMVLETYGTGNTSSQPWFIQLLQQAIKRGILLVNITQCMGGSVIVGKYSSSCILNQIGVLSGYDMTTEAAVTKLMFLLGQSLDRNQLKTAFETSLRGELTRD